MMNTETELIRQLATALTATIGNANASGFATANEVAKYLGISRSMVHKLIHEGQIPHTRYGRAVRVPRRWLVEQSNTGG